jgi:AcrR family transcriptional regulator
MSASPPSLRRRRKEARPQELLDAALAVFVEKGFAASRAEEVAARAGVSKGTLYLYYPSKEDLLKAVIKKNLSERLAAGAAQAADFEGSATELARSLLVDWWTQIYDDPASAVFKLVITEARNFPEIAEFYAHEVIEPAHRLMTSIIQRGIDRGEFRPIDVSVAMHSLILPLIMVCLHKHSIGACSQTPALFEGPAFIREHVDLVLAGLATGAPAQLKDARTPASKKARPVRASP